MNAKDRFKELVVEVLQEADEALGYHSIRERVLDLAKSRGKSIKSLSSVCHRTFHYILRCDEEKRFDRIGEEPSIWKLTTGETV